MKKLVLVLFLLWAGNAYSQSYQSIFGQGATRWNVAFMPADAVITDSVWYSKDTILNGITWKKVIGRPVSFTGGLFLEDTLRGKVWYKSLSAQDTATKLVFDFSLQVGDTFDISNGWRTYTAAEKVVDSVYTSGGRKHIRFKGGIGWGPQIFERFLFIEGVGANISPVYKDPSQKYSSTYLLCTFKDGTKVYGNAFFQGNCNVTITALPDMIIESKVKVFPSPFADQLFIHNKSSMVFSAIEIYNAEGLLVYQGKYTPSLMLARLPKGMYWIVLRPRKGMSVTKKILKN